MNRTTKSDCSYSALRAVAATLGELSTHTFETLGDALGGREPAPSTLAEIRSGLGETQSYVARIAFPEDGRMGDAREVSALHVIDQLRRLLDRCHQHARLGAIERDPAVADAARQLAESVRICDVERA